MRSELPPRLLKDVGTLKLTHQLDAEDLYDSTTGLFMDMAGATLSGTRTVGLADDSLKLRVTTIRGNFRQAP